MPEDSPLGMILAERLVEEASNTVLGPNQLDYRRVTSSCCSIKLILGGPSSTSTLLEFPLEALKFAPPGELTSPYIDFV
jgi:hypothetical protein